MIDGAVWTAWPESMFKDQWEGPGAFLGTGRQRSRSPEEWVSVAEDLASKHGGVLPCVGWLIKNEYNNLAHVMWKHPELFRHIKQDKPRKSPEEWVPAAERLANDHGGVLPCLGWLVKNKHNGLAQAMRKQPELFEHIKQDKPNKSPEEWVPVAESLAGGNGGVLPCVKWLEKNGHHGLNHAMRNRPDLFQHIKQDKKVGRTPEEWVLIAEALADEYGGVLPYREQIRKHGHIGLYGAMNRRPDLFLHIPQQVMSCDGRLLGVRVDGQIQSSWTRQDAERFGQAATPSSP